MSVNTLEKVLWDLSVDKESRRRFREEPQAFLKRYALNEEERRLVADFDVGALAARGVSTLLTMGYWMEAEGSRNMGEYLRRMKAAAPARLPDRGSAENRPL